MRKDDNATETKETTKVFVGIDVSLAHLDVGILSFSDCREFQQYEHNLEGMKKLLKELLILKPEIVVVEATGGIEKEVVYYLAQADVNVVCINPRQVRDFARATGRLAKTDRIDAHVLASFGRVIKSETRPLKGEELELISELNRRRAQLVLTMAAEKNHRRYIKNDIVLASIDAHMMQLESMIEEIEKELDSQIEGNPKLKGRRDLLETFKGVGSVTSSVLISQMLELGSLNSKEVAALAGLAPFNRDSGKFRSKQMIRGGRADVRRALFLAAFSAIRYNNAIRTFYSRLIAAGKKKKVAMVACMRKIIIILNAMLKANETWKTC